MDEGMSNPEDMRKYLGWTLATSGKDRREDVTVLATGVYGSTLEPCIILRSTGRGLLRGGRAFLLYQDTFLFQLEIGEWTRV